MKRMVFKTVGVAIIAAMLFPAAAFAAPKANAAPGADKAETQKERQVERKAIQEQRKADRAEIKAQRQADQEAMKTMTDEERQAFIEKRKTERRAAQVEKRAQVKEKVKQHRIKKLQEIKAKKEANGTTGTPGYQRIIDWLAKLVGIK